MPQEKTVIALEARLKGCRNVTTLGVKTNLADYGPEGIKAIRSAERIYYPTTFYADLFDAMGKSTFPSYHTYKFVMDKIKQTALFDLLSIPHPKTRAFYGKRQARTITNHFSFPFVAKIPRGSAMGRGVYLIQNQNDLDRYLDLTTTAYIQEYLKVDRDIRVVVIGKRVIHAYWRLAAAGEFRSNVARGGRVVLDSVPRPALDLALETARLCQWDDVGIDVVEFKGRYLVLEANMKYGKEGFRAAGLSYLDIMESLIQNGEI